ncbi:MAG: ABC transporter ATP-binding protein [Thermaerobacter sp.]|nr:ABC transporter ATP-binding protein [Thermaerobacter sp.]
MTTKAIECHGLTKRYGPQLALSDVTLAIPEGRKVAILGPNGAGKTTFISLWLGLLHPTAGTCSIRGQSPDAAIRQGWVGAVLQETVLPSLVTASELLTHVGRFYPHPLSAAGCLALAGIPELASRRVDHLSGGQRRRVAFALALVGQPRLLFLDEPTESMDLDARDGFWRQVTGWAEEEGRTICFSTHNLAEAERYADDVVVLHRGTLVAFDTPEQLARGAGVARVRFTAHGESAADLQGRLGVGIRALSNGGRFEAVGDNLDTLLRAVVPDPACSEFDPLQDTLEDAFRELVRSHDQGGTTA